MGVFVRHVYGEAVVGDPNHALFFNHGECYQVSHPVKGGDQCTVLAFSDTAVKDCLEQLDPEALKNERRLFRHTHVPTSPAFDLLHRQLLGVARAEHELLATDEIAANMLAGLIEGISGSTTSLNRTVRKASTLRHYDDLVSAVREELARRLGEKLSLSDIAAAVRVSPFHLSRVFRLRTGMSLSSYHRRLRLRTALQRIIDGDDNLTQLAIEHGFSHHSHFSSAFRRELGIPPSAVRDDMSAVEFRKAATTLRGHRTAIPHLRRTNCDR
jgi:AraC-like DNA-binding protein